MFGFDALAAFTHHCEGAFERVRKGEAVASAELVAAVPAAQDHMRALAEGREASEAEGQALLARLHAAVDGGAGEVASDAPQDTTWRVRFSFPPEALANGTRPLPLIDERAVKSIAWESKKLGVPKKITMHNGWEIVFYSSEGPPPNGVDVDLVVFDEEITQKDWYDEMAARLLDRSGRFIWSATPQDSSDSLLSLYERAVDSEGDPEPVIEKWKAKVGRTGIDGAKLIAAARELVAKYTERARND